MFDNLVDVLSEQGFATGNRKYPYTPMTELINNLQPLISIQILKLKFDDFAIGTFQVAFPGNEQGAEVRSR